MKFKSSDTKLCNQGSVFYPDGCQLDDGSFYSKKYMEHDEKKELENKTSQRKTTHKNNKGHSKRSWTHHVNNSGEIIWQVKGG